MRVKYFLIILAFILIFLGCGGGGGSDTGVSIVSGQISGKISFENMLANERNIIAENSGQLRASGFSQTIVFLEEMPSRAVYPDADGNFCFTDLPFDTSYHVIARINSLTGRIFKVRSERIFLEHSTPTHTKNFLVTDKDEAKYQIRLQVNDTKDNAVGRCNIWFWGEEFSIDEGGCYASPLMPLGATGKIKIIPPSNRELATVECDVDSSTFQSKIQGISSVTLPPYGITQKRAPYISVRVGEILPGGASIRIYGNAIDPQNDYLGLEWSTNVGTFTYTSFDKSYVEWSIPSEPVTALITFRATQLSSTLYPLLYSYAQLPIRISTDGNVSFPGEIIIVPTTRHLELISSASSQITGNTVAKYEAIASFPGDPELFYTWNSSLGKIISDDNLDSIFWFSPTLENFETKIAVISCSVTDGIATLTNELSVNVTAFPTVVIDTPVESEFYPGPITFTGNALDYMAEEIGYDNYCWYIATGTGELECFQNGGATFTYNFTTKDSYTIALEAEDNSGIIGTATKVISIMNLAPKINILSPEDDSGYLKDSSVAFKVKVTDYEDGAITSPDSIKWYSDIDHEIGSGTSFELGSMSKGMHTISVVVKDSDGAISSSSVVIWYDMPARITLTPAKGSVFWGNVIKFAAKGVNVDNQPLDSSKYKWYLDGSDTPWKEGVESFTGNLTNGLHKVKVVGYTGSEEVSSDYYPIEVGWPKPVIISPENGTSFEPGSTQTFSANIGATGTLSLGWYIDGNQSLTNSGDKLVTSLDLGRHTISYRGEDASGKIASSTIEIAVEKIPEITTNYNDNAIFFINHDIKFEAVCLDSNGDAIAQKNIKWYLIKDEIPTLLASGKTLLLSQGDGVGQLSPGNHKLCVSATGPFGTVASKTIEIVSGVPVVSIDKPSNLDRFCLDSFSVNENIRFEALPKNSPIPLVWYCNGNLLSSESAFTHGFTASDTYLISVIGTDSANISNSAYIYLTVGKFPIMDFLVKTLSEERVDPTDGVFFNNQDISFWGFGTDVAAEAAISSSNMTWCAYDEHENKKPIEGAYSEILLLDSFIKTLGEGPRKIELTGKSAAVGATVGKKIKTMYFNLPRVHILKPSDGDIIRLDPLDPEKSENFIASATPDSNEYINMEWWCDWGTTKAFQLADAETGETNVSSITLKLPAGAHTLTYIGTDTTGLVSQQTIKLVVSNGEVIVFSPGDETAVFEKPLKLEITNGNVDTNKVNWNITYKGANIKLNGNTSPYILSENEMSNIFKEKGSYVIKVSSPNALGVNSNASNTIYYGLADASIVRPVEEYFAADSNPIFTATPTAETGYSIKAEHTEWHIDDLLIPEFTNKHSIAINPGVGKHTLKYVAIDGAGNSTSDSIEILFDDGPNANIYCRNGSTLANNAVFYELTEMESIVFIGNTLDTTTQLEIDPANMHWNLYYGSDVVGEPILSRDGLKTINLEKTDFSSIGTYTISLTVEDNFGIATTTISSFYYGVNPPEIISHFDNQNILLINANQITFSGTVDPRAYLPVVWEDNYGSITDILGNEPSITVYNMNAKRGKHIISYKAIDSNGKTMTDSINITIDNKPVMAIKIGVSDIEDNAVFFALSESEILLFTGTAYTLNEIGIREDIYGNRMNWKLIPGDNSSDNAIKTINGSGNFALSHNDFGGIGTFTILLEVTDSYETKGEFYKTFYYGYPVPRISKPVNNEIINLNSTYSLIGNNTSEAYLKKDWLLGTTDTVIGSGDQIAYDFNTLGSFKITYTATDSAKKTKSDSVDVVVDEPPDVNMALINDKSVDNAVFFKLEGSDKIRIKGTARGKITPEISFSNMTWNLYRDGSMVPQRTYNGTDYIELSATELNTVGTWTLALKVEDDYGCSKTVSSTFYYGYTNPRIISPSREQSLIDISAASNLTVSGTAETNVFLPRPMEWFKQDSLVPIAVGSTKSLNLSRGEYIITYVGTDSAGIEKRDTVAFVVNGSPELSITSPSDNSKFFGGQNLRFTGSARKCGNTGLIDVSSIKWYKVNLSGREEALLGEGSNDIVVDANLLGTGTFYVRMVGVDTDFNQNLLGSASIKITCGIQHPRIVRPIAESIYEIGSNVIFEGNYLAPTGSSESMITGTWTSDDRRLNKNGAIVETSTLTRGWRTIKYTGKDSGNFEASDTIRILVDTKPVFTVNPTIRKPAISWYGKDSYDNTYDVVIASEGTSLNFVVSAVNSAAIPSSIASITWYNPSERQIVPGSLRRPNDFGVNLKPGSYTYTIIIEDEYGVQNSTTYSFGVWECETYDNYNGASYMTTQNNNSLIIGTKDNSNNYYVINKLTRNNTSDSNSGDLTLSLSTETTQWTLGYKLMGLDIVGNDIHTIGGDNLGKVRYQKWNIGATITSEAANDIFNNGGSEDFKTSLNSVGGIIINGEWLYVCSKTDGSIKKISLVTHECGAYSASGMVVEPFGICRGSSNNMFVADFGGNMISMIDGSCNEINYIDDIDSPTNLVYSNNTKKLYVTSQSKNLIHVIDVDKGKYLYSFGKVGSTPNQGEFANNGIFGIAIAGSGALSDLYVSDEKNNRIVRFRCGFDW